MKSPSSKVGVSFFEEESDFRYFINGLQQIKDEMALEGEVIKIIGYE
jgi:hypothetical protein